jgi:glutamine cyclotransferase
LSPELSRNISRTFSKLGIIPIGPIKTFSHTILASELKVGETVSYYSYANDTAGNEAKTEIKSFTVQTVEVVSKKIETSIIKEEQEEAEIDKPVKWKKEMIVTNPSSEEVKGYNVTGLPKDAKNIIVKDETGKILYKDKNSWETDITGKENISYFVEYETKAPYKEENIIQPFLVGKKYLKRIAVKSDFTEHYRNVKAYTDIPEELSKNNYIIKLYRVIDDSKTDVTNSPQYNVKFVDSDNNNINDRIEWNVPMLSSEQFEVEASITIINVQSYPTVFGNWTIRFNTTGTSDLKITPINNTNFDVDIQFLELRCGNNKVNPIYDGKSVFYPNWSCLEEGMIINQVLKPGKHTLEFRFGDDVEYAYNLAILEKAMVAYISNTGVNGLNSPKVKVWNNETGWGNEIELDSAGSPVRFVKLAFSPKSSKRIIVTQSDDGYLDAYVSIDGTTWTFSSNISYAGAATQRRFDVRFETATGDALVVYGVVDADVTHDLAYKVLPTSSTSFSGISEQYIDDTSFNGGNNLQYTWVALDRDPASSSEELIIVGFDSSGSDINALVWDGNTWGNRIELTATATFTGGGEALAVKYASDGSKGMVLAADGNSGNVVGRYWNGASWTTANPGDVDSTDGLDVKWITLKTDPATDDLQAVFVDSGSDLHTAYWNGSSWSVTSNIDTSVDRNDARPADFAWNPSGSTGILIWDYTGSSTMLRYRTCSPQCTGTTQTNSTYTGVGYWMQAVTNPRNEDNTKILIGRLNDNFDIGSINRSSTSFSNYGDSVVTADTAVTTYESFDITFLLVEPVYGWLNVTIDNPNPSTYTDSNPLELSQYDIFVVNATVECKDGLCGTVSGSVRYNNSLGEPNILISTTEGDTPFYIVGESYQTRDDDYVYKNWNFSVANEIKGNPTGIAYNGTYFWVLNRTNKATIFRYKADGTYDGWSKDISAQDTYMEGIDVNDTHIFVVGSNNDNVYIYDMAGNFITSFSVASQTTNPISIVTNNTYIWVLSSVAGNRYVYRYWTNGTKDIRSGADWNYDFSGSVIPDGLEFNGTHFFISDSVGTGGHVWGYNLTGNYVYWNFSTVEDSPFGLAYYESEKNFYTVDYNDKYVRRYEKNTIKTGKNPISCGVLNQGDICRLNWTVNATGTPGDYKIDVNFSSSYYPNVNNNDTLNAYIRIGSRLSFDIQLPGEPWIPSSKTKPGTLTTPIEFNASGSTDLKVQPCVVGYSCASGYKQDTSTPIFTFKNTGNIAERWNISLSQSLSSYGITVYGNTSSNPTLQEINTSGWIASNNIPVGSSVKAWLWADFVNSPAGTIPNIYINHTSLQA